MFLNCYDGYDVCRFAVRVKEGVDSEKLGNFISKLNDFILFWEISVKPEGAVVRY